MNTRQDEALPYRDLARQKARIFRHIGLDQLSRLATLNVASMDEEPADVSTETAAGSDLQTGILQVDMQFDQDTDGLVRVTGGVAGRLKLLCNGCAEALSYELALTFDGVIVDSDQRATEVAVDDNRNRDVIVCDGPEIELADIVEDEVLLALPERLCLAEPCPNAPVLDYPLAEQDAAAAAEADEAGRAEESNPFSVLAGLKTQD